MIGRLLVNQRTLILRTVGVDSVVVLMRMVDLVRDRRRHSADPKQDQEQKGKRRTQGRHKWHTRWKAERVSVLPRFAQLETNRPCYSSCTIT